jgi:sugar phosphate isomerase/epimerase
MIESLYFSVAYDEVDATIPHAEREGLGIEVTLYDTAWMMSDGALDQARETGEELADRGIAVTAHGPLYDLNPGSLDPTVRTYTGECFTRGVQVAAALGADKVVYHTAYNPLLPDGVLTGWKELAAPIWADVLATAAVEGVQVCLENSYEPSAEFFRDLYDAFSDGSAAMCFDPAHVHLYSNDGQSNWMVVMGDRVTHLHLNDNSGSSDDHLGLGAGNIPYREFLTDLCDVCCGATVVLEMQVERALASIEFLRGLDLWGND